MDICLGGEKGQLKKAQGELCLQCPATCAQLCQLQLTFTQVCAYKRSLTKRTVPKPVCFEFWLWVRGENALTRQACVLQLESVQAPNVPRSQTVHSIGDAAERRHHACVMRLQISEGVEISSEILLHVRQPLHDSHKWIIFGMQALEQLALDKRVRPQPMLRCRRMRGLIYIASRIYPISFYPEYVTLKFTTLRACQNLGHVRR